MQMIDFLTFSDVSDRMDFQLSQILRPIGSAIAASAERIRTIENQYRIDSDDEWQFIAEERDMIEENLLGCGFVASQAHVTAVVSKLARLYNHHNFAKDLTSTPIPESKKDMLRFGFC